MVDKIYTFIVGAQYHGLAAVHAMLALQAGDALIPVREPDNPADANAVMLLNQFGQFVGYVRRTKAVIVAKWMDEGYLVLGRVTYPHAKSAIGPGVIKLQWPRAVLTKDRPLEEERDIIERIEVATGKVKELIKI